ncbi:MAG: hypothetical protein ACR2K2_13025 [Mycobacteriales bacterium]
MPYSQMLYGAVLSAALAAVLTVVLGRTRQPAILLAAALSAFVMPLAWNLILKTTQATGLLSHDLPFKPFPISWQDTGSGVFTLAGASLIIAFGPGRTYTPARVARLTVLTAVAALLIDVYTY